MLLIQRTRGAVALHGNDTDRCRTDFEPKQKIQRHSQAIRQCNSDDIGVADQCEGQARLSYAQPLDGGKHPRLNLNHQLASRKRVPATHQVELAPLLNLAQLFEGSAGPGAKRSP